MFAFRRPFLQFLMVLFPLLVLAMPAAADQVSFADLVAQELSDSAYQTELPGPDETPDEDDWKPPAWLAGLLKILLEILYYGFIAGAVVGIGLLLWLFLANARGWNIPFRKKQTAEAEKKVAPGIAGSKRGARHLPAEADDLLRSGDVVGAMRLLLQLAVAELVNQRILRITRDETGREIAERGHDALADPASLGVIVTAIEVHLFAGVPADEDAYQACRSAYDALLKSLAKPQPPAGAAA